VWFPKKVKTFGLAKGISSARKKPEPKDQSMQKTGENNGKRK